jgi:hypothetical protein
MTRVSVEGLISRRALLQTAALAGLAAYGAPRLVFPPEAAAAAWDRREYLAYADRIITLLDGRWSFSGNYYNAGMSGETSTNANVLLVHAVAAKTGHQGRSRRDDRARALAKRLCESPPWHSAPLNRAVGIYPGGWRNTMTAANGSQHPVIDTAVVRGLAAAYDARDELDLAEATRAAIRDVLRRCAYSTFYSWPKLRLNQINWPIEIYAHAAEVLQEPHLLLHDSRMQFGRFADACTHVPAGMVVPYLGPGYRFHYLPQTSDAAQANVDSSEYANIVCGALAFYEQGLRAGMTPLTTAQLRVLRAWVERVLCGYWTHSGYPNWDSGLGFDRWHQAKKFPLSQEGLLAIAAAKRFQPSPAYGAWAKWLFDRGLDWYERQVTKYDGLPPCVFFGVDSDFGVGDDELTASRMAANACRAVQAGLGEATSRRPPPLYAYDPDIGRLAVTTPAYSTAIILDNHRAFPYGGADPARFFDGDQHVVASVGGTGDTAFGMTVVDHAAGAVIRSQRARSGGSVAHPQLRLIRAPRGASRQLTAYPSHAYAGSFRDLICEAATRGRSAAIVSRHRFRSEFVESRWSLLPRAGRRSPHTVRLTFPSWGKQATITAVLRDGSRLEVGKQRIAIRHVAWFHVAGADRGYVVVPRSPSLPGLARILRPGPQRSAPHPGPTLVLELLAHRRLRKLTATVRYAPATSAADAERVASKLLRTF